MSKTIVECSAAGCGHPAAYKIAAAWSDGTFSELKTYGHACPAHLGEVFRAAEARRASYRPAEGESIDELGIYKFEPGKRDRQLQRLWGLEENYRS
jgi:hypothetical protein